MLHKHCPNCEGDKIEGFFPIKNAPIFSLVTVKSREEALNVPRKDIELAFCHSCGFIFNRLFDTSIDYFTMGYEDQQGFSTTFMNYLKKISEGLIGKYNLKGKTLLEIGCGKGDFINLLTELSQGKGIGVDPAYQEGRQNNPNLTFYKEFYKMEHGKLPADFICCRHTLEHIHGTKAFLQLIRDSLGNSTDKIIFFEIPQITRILEVQAFWDIYYEHCSYFSAGSLARLFRSTGYEILDLRLDYNDQYLLIEAKPVLSPSKKSFPIEESIAEQKQRVENFKIKINEQLADWRNKLALLKAGRKKTVVWGGGSKSVGFLTNFADLDLIEYVVDINPHMENNFIPGIGKKYVQPKFLKDYKPEAVIIMNGIYKDEITKTLHSMDVYPEVYAL
ncbi:MAG TPA: class I SAM-dependent methyltransferase [Bacteroidales bacterium]|nr:class I SAM-dependent methyltransferase [Bacteroidales bacterium]